MNVAFIVAGCIGVLGFIGAFFIRSLRPRTVTTGRSGPGEEGLTEG